MQRLFPNPADHVTVREAYDVPRPRPTGRPWVSLCMVSSLDGSIVLDENSRALSNPVDQQVLLTLRSLADVVLVGARTVRADGYGPPRADGPRFVVVSRTASFTFEERFWSSDRAVLLLPEDGPDVPVPCLRAGRGTPDLVAALATLEADLVLSEGGATLNGLLTAADLVDELNLTWSPQMAGGDGSRLTRGAPEGSRPMRLVHLLEDDGFVFSRYVRAR
jgi:5-amino-6-(5-phosphoribosylamino)uracil reductase